jgi:hypothetical protein
MSLFKRRRRSSGPPPRSQRTAEDWDILRMFLSMAVGAGLNEKVPLNELREGLRRIASDLSDEEIDRLVHEFASGVQLLKERFGQTDDEAKRHYLRDILALTASAANHPSPIALAEGGGQ